MTIRERGGSQTKSFKIDVCWGNPISGRSRIYHIIVRKRKLVPGANAMRFSDQSSTAVASTLRLPAIFLGGKTCCAFDCTPNVDTAIEDKIKG